MFKTNFYVHITIWGAKMYLGCTAQERPPWLRACWCYWIVQS